MCVFVGRMFVDQVMMKPDIHIELEIVEKCFKRDAQRHEVGK